MTKRTFIKTSSALASGAALSQLTSCSAKTEGPHLKNWAGNLTYSTGNVHYPKTVEQVQAVVKRRCSPHALHI